jgi:hypothetical protein
MFSESKHPEPRSTSTVTVPVSSLQDDFIVQRKADTGREDEELEREADQTADHVMRMPENNFIQYKSAGSDLGTLSGRNDFSSSRSGGRSLDTDVHSFMSDRFANNFQGVKIHTDKQAAQLSQNLHAKAFTVGKDIYFNEGQFQPGSVEGKRLLAHELTHVLQQNKGFQQVQRDGMGDARIAEAYHAVIDEIKATAVYKALDPNQKKLTDEIIANIEKKPGWPVRHSYILKLKTLFVTKEKPPAVVSAETKGSTQVAVVSERKRVAKPEAAKNITLEEKASSDPSRVWVAIKGKFGGGTYYVDRSNPSNIVVKAKVYLKIAGTGTAADISNIKQMEDGIEKAASMKGFTVDVTFVKAPDAETFTADVDPSRWEDATNWSGGEPRGFAHELLHMFAFEVDRYNYIESHAENESMVIGSRLHWFNVQLQKPDNWDNPLSIMGYGQHPLDDDACRVAGLDIAICVAARQKAAKP